MRHLVVVALSLVALACSPAAEPPLPPPPAPTVVSFTVTPATGVTPGDTVTLAWETKDASSVSIEQVGVGPVSGATAVSGTAQATVQADTVFVLTARGEGGTDARAAGVQVAGSAAAPLFVALPPVVHAGESVTLSWFACGATTTTLTDGDGQVTTLTPPDVGAVTVAPLKSTTWTLTADGTPVTASVRVLPVIDSFAVDGNAPRAGGAAKLVWHTRGATQVTLTRAGEAAPLLDETDPSKVESGDFTDLLPAELPQGGLVTYTLEAWVGSEVVTQVLEVRLAGALRFVGWDIPAYGRPGNAVPVSWSTAGAATVVVSVDGRAVFLTGTPAEVAQGATLVDVAAAPQLVTITAIGATGERVTVSGTLEAVGPVTFGSFTASTQVLAQGGDPVTLSWQVTNARRVRISQVGGGFTVERTGAVDSGSVTVRPNQPLVSYQLEADNQAGSAIAPRFVTVKVPNPSVVTVSRKLPQGSATTLTGTTAPGAVTVYGLPSAQLNVTGEAFVDIEGTGTEVTGFASGVGPSTTDGSAVVALPGMDLRLFGRPMDATRAVVSVNGWFAFSDQLLVSRPTVPINTSLYPLALAPMAADLELGAGRVHWRRDAVGGVDRLIVQWTDVHVRGDPSTRATFQAQVYATGRVVFAYRTVQLAAEPWASGVLDSSEVLLAAPALPASGDTVTFFGGVAVSSLPRPHTVLSGPYFVTLETASGRFEALLDDRLRQGELAISEVNPRPGTGLVNAEWIELLNNSGTPIDLDGWTMVSGASSHTIVGPLVLAPYSRALLAQAADLGDGVTGVTVDYLYPGSFLMPDAPGQLDLRPPGASGPFVRIYWNASIATANGIAVQADPATPGFRLVTPFLAPTCSAKTSYGTSGQKGTPGAVQPRCFPYELEVLPAGGFEPLSGIGTRHAPPVGVGSIDVTVQVFLSRTLSFFGNTTSNLSVCTNGWLTTTPSTSTSFTNKTQPSSTVPVGAIAPYWSRLEFDPTVASNGLFSLQRDPDGMPGTGDEVTIVSWEGARGRTSSFIGEALDVQVVFHANGDLDFQYGRATPAMRGQSATTWLENLTGTYALAVDSTSTRLGIQPNTGYRFRYVP